MGGGSYTASDWSKLKQSRSINDTSSYDEIFKSRSMKDMYNPRLINLRESRDNDEHPNSTPIAIGVDVTGSMGYLSEEIIKNGLDSLMKTLYSSQVIPDPQLMFAACGDYMDYAPLQITQFESDIRIATQLMDLWIEGHGCGNGGEDYQLLWYFLAHHTDTDSMKKRNKKGYAFTIGDEPCHPYASTETIYEVFGDTVLADLKTSDIADECEKKYNLFHIFIEHGSYDRTAVIPGKTIYISSDEVKYIPELIITAICKCEGKNPSDILGDIDGKVQKIIDRAFKEVSFGEVINI